MAVLRKELVPAFEGLQANKDSLNIVIASVDKVCQNLHWLTTVSPKQGFCWGIVASCCSKIPVRKDSLKWVQDFGECVTQLCRIYKVSHVEMTKRGGKFKEELPNDEYIKRYVLF